jgi:nitrate/TMAO reductase-like tetraheme cytochrome c subunit
VSLLARLVLIFLLLVGAGLFAGSLVLESPAEPEPPEPDGGGALTPPAGPEAKPGVLDAPENCRRCHEEIYREWQQDRHSKAWTGALYTEISDNHKDPTCWPCHAPRPILETGVNSPAEARKNFREAGITCLTCHRRGRHVVGPIADPGDTPEVSADCGPVYDPDYPVDRPDAQATTIAFCGVCHNLHGTHTEFMGSKYFGEGKTCLSCHMGEEVMAPVAKGGRPRLRRVHRMPGAHSPEMLKRAMEFSARHEGGRILARVTNKGAGHKIPTDARHRSIDLRIAFFDAFGQPVPVPHPESGMLEREVRIDRIRLFYRQEQREPTQVDPAGTPGRNNWRESSIQVPAEARGGHARLRLFYNLKWSWPPEKATLVQEGTVKLDG